MGFGIDDTRKKQSPKVKDLIKDGIIGLEDVTDWLRTIYEIRFFEEKVFELLARILSKALHTYTPARKRSPSAPPPRLSEET